MFDAFRGNNKIEAVEAEVIGQRQPIHADALAPNALSDDPQQILTDVDRSDSRATLLQPFGEETQPRADIQHRLAGQRFRQEFINQNLNTAARVIHG